MAGFATFKLLQCVAIALLGIQICCANIPRESVDTQQAIGSSASHVRAGDREKRSLIPGTVGGVGVYGGSTGGYGYGSQVNTVQSIQSVPVVSHIQTVQNIPVVSNVQTVQQVPVVSTVQQQIQPIGSIGGLGGGAFAGGVGGIGAGFGGGFKRYRESYHVKARGFGVGGGLGGLGGLGGFGGIGGLGGRYKVHYSRSFAGAGGVAGAGFLG